MRLVSRQQNGFARDEMERFFGDGEFGLAFHHLYEGIEGGSMFAEPLSFVESGRCRSGRWPRS